MNHLLNFVLLGFIGAEPFILLLLAPVAIMILPFIFFLVTMQNTLNLISPENRRMQPGEVWFSLIPFFGIIWQFIMVNRIADSLRNEFEAHQLTLYDPRPGAGIGLAYCIIFCLSVITPFLGFVGLICWIIYWVKINNYRSLLFHHKYNMSRS